jgi:CysZ protein
MRHRAPSEAVALRRRHSRQDYLAGVIISGLVAVPVLNLLTPLFATAFMTRLHKRLAEWRRAFVFRSERRSLPGCFGRR